MSSLRWPRNRSTTCQATLHLMKIHRRLWADATAEIVMVEAVEAGALLGRGLSTVFSTNPKKGHNTKDCKEAHQAKRNFEEGQQRAQNPAQAVSHVFRGYWSSNLPYHPQFRSTSSKVTSLRSNSNKVTSLRSTSSKATNLRNTSSQTTSSKAISLRNTCYQLFRGCPY